MVTLRDPSSVLKLQSDLREFTFLPVRLKSRMLPSTCGGAAEPAGTTAQSSGNRVTLAGDGGREGLGVQEWSDGSRYEGGFVDGLKHGKGRYTGRNGEYYEGSFFKDYKHGDGLWCWPTGYRFTGRFYLNRKEGYGQEVFPNGDTFQGLYYRDQRFGPGVATYSDGRQDVGLWLGHRLLKLCTSAEESFSLSDITGYSTFLQPSVCAASAESQSFLSGLHTKDGTNLKYIDLLGDESFILPPGMEHYSTNGDHLPLPPGRRRVLDQLFYGEHWEPDPYQGYERDPLSTLPLQARMQAHIHKHRLMAKHVGWDVAAVLSMNREGFGPKGPVEVQSELFIQHSSRGQYWDVSRIFQTRIVHPDVANSQGHTALIAATVNCHDDVIHLLLDMGVDINKLNSEGMSALAVCQVLLYPSLHTILTKPPVMMSPSLSEINSVLSELDLTSLTPVLNNDTEKIKLEEVDEQAEDGEARRDQDAADVEHSIQNKDEDLTQKQSADSTSLLSSVNATKNFLQCSSEVLNHTGFPLSCDTQETVCRVPAMNIERHMRLKTLKVLLERGADPNLARVPLPVLFLAIMAGDTEVVKTLLLFGAHTDVPLPPEYKGLYPLHVAAALPGPQGPVITEILIQSLPDLDLDLQACDEDEIYEPDRISMMALKLRSSRDSPGLGKGGRTALHVACQREFDYMNASKVVSILLSHRASTNLLWSGHSPLSLAVASGNHLAVQELLNGGADPNTPLGPTVGSALCALININYNFGENKMKILDMLSNADADIFMPVKVDGVEGTVFDYAHSILKENFDLDHTQAHTFGGKERKVLEARQLQNAMVNLLRHKCKGMGAEDLSPESQESAETSRLPGFCFFCGCSISKKLTACTQDHKVFCSRTCKNKDKVVHVPANMKENYSFN
nr:ankyrin repeat and MYND domain-containing protein 1 isoform X2 [Nothobranchius furzeri]